MDLDHDSRALQDSAEEVASPKIMYEMSPEASRYFQGDAEPATSSVLISDSKYLNDPFYREAWALFALRRNGHDLPSTYVIPIAAKALAAVTDFTEFARLVDAEKAINEEFAAWLAKRRYTEWRCSDLEGGTPGTLGHMLWEFLEPSAGMAIELQGAGVEIANDLDFIAKRRAATHDIEHMVTGFGLSAAGEVGVNYVDITAPARYFSPDLAQQMTAGQQMLTTAYLQQVSLHYHAAYATVLEAVQLGIQMGTALKRPLLMESWEDYLDWQLDDIRTHLGIVPGPGAAWDWTNAATEG